MDVSVQNLLSLGCDTLYSLRKLGLMDDIMKTRMGVLKLLKETLLVSSLAGSSKESTIKEVVDCINNYDANLFHSYTARQEQVSSDITLFTRLISYIYDRKIKCIATDIPYSIDQANVIFNKVHVDKITGKYDFIFQYPDGKFEAVKLKFSEPTLSFKARNALNLPYNSPELICMAAGLTESMNVALWHLKSKEDKKGNFAEFEHKKGCNIISVTFTEDIDLKEHLQIMLDKQKIECSDCSQKSLCSLPQIRFPYTIKDSTAPTVSETIQYTERQIQVINHVNGPMSVVAVPGAGKTKALVARIEKLVTKENVSPKNILAICFQRKACLEIIERVEKILHLSREDEDFPKISTFNSLGFDILRENGDVLGELRLASDLERKSIIEEILSLSPRINGVSYYLYGNFGLLNRLDRLFQEIEESGEELFRENHSDMDVASILSAYRVYRSEYNNRGYISFDDQITLVNELFIKRPDIADYYRLLYQYIMVDEFQDVNSDQMILIRRLAQHQNIVVVGDPKQSIFQFRKADNRFLLQFSRYFPGAKTVVMEDNFRSNDKILSAADRYLSLANENDRKFVSHKSAKFKPLFIKGANATTCISYLSKLMKQYQPGDIAIISRNNKTLIELSEILTENDIKTASVKDYIREDAVFLLFYDLLTIYYKDFDNLSVYRLTKSIVDWSFYDTAYDTSIYASLLNDGFILPIDLSDPDTFQAYETLTEPNEFEKAFFKIFQSLNIIKYNTGFEEMFRAILKIWYNAEEHPVIDILLDDTEQKLLSLKELYQLMTDMILYEDSSRVGYVADPMSVNLLTAHDSKGKEFPVVIIYGSDVFDQKEQQDRYLFYVAMTRAKSTLIVMQFDVVKDELDSLSECFQLV